MAITVIGDDVLVDDEFYFDTYPDAAASGQNADNHYYNTGWLEGFNPNPYFSTNGYLAANPDVSGFVPVFQYGVAGWREGRDPGIGFDNELYLQANPDVAAAGINPLRHYIVDGVAEGRQIYAAVGRNIASNSFDTEYYLLANPDAGSAGTDPLSHYRAVGWQEGLNPSSYFSTSQYLQLNPDVAAAGVNPLDHYNDFGWREGRNPSVLFDTNAYLASNPDVAAAGINPLSHFLEFGIYEGRSPLGDDRGLPSGAIQALVTGEFSSLMPYMLSPDGTGPAAPEDPDVLAAAEQTDTFAALLFPSNGSGVMGVAVARFDEEQGTVELTVRASGLTPGQIHPQHIHGFADDRPSLLPNISLDTDRDGFVEDPEGEPVVGPVLLSATASGEVTNAAVSPDFPVADAQGNLAFTQTYSFNLNEADDASIFQELQDRFVGREFQIHGLDVPPGQGAGTVHEVNGTGGYIDVLPVANGVFLPFQPALVSNLLSDSWLLA